jgi:gliding motility-associated-like protein
VYTDGSNSYTLNNITSSSFSWNINPSSSASYILVSVTDSTGCTGTVSGNANVTVYARPTADAGADKEVCGTSISLSASPSMGSGLWSGAPDVIFSDASDPNTAISLPAYGAYTCTWTETNGICTDDDDIQVVAHEPPAAPYAGIDQDIYFAESAEISASAPGAGTGMWSITSGSGSIADPYSPSTTVTHLSNGDVILQWTVTNGTCAPASDEVVLHIKEPMIPSGFSPNNDNSNDRFVIKGIEQASQSSLVILNRWGSEIYKASPYNNEWNGSNQQGESLPEDTYFYVLSMNEKTYTGYIVLKRK